MRDAVRDLLLPGTAGTGPPRRDHLANTADPSDGELRQAAEMYELAGYPDPAARQLIRAARAAVRNAALDVAEQHLAAAHALTGRMPEAALDVLIERIETPPGRSRRATATTAESLRSIAAGDARRLLVATARAAYSAGLRTEARQLLVRLEEIAEPTDLDLAVLRAHAALVHRQADAIHWASSRLHGRWRSRFDVACECLLITGTAARRRHRPCSTRAEPSPGTERSSPSIHMAGPDPR